MGGMKTGPAHILVYRRCFTDKEDNDMCDMNWKEPTGCVRGEPDRDVDDLIFQNEQEWLASER